MKGTSGRRRARGLGLGVMAIVCVLLRGSGASAETEGELFASGTKALDEGRPVDAIGSFEALADQGVEDSAVSFNRALAYAQRVRMGAGQPGDLGQAVHGFEEARELSSDPRLAQEASRAVQAIRSEIARRRVRKGESADLEKGDPLGRSIVRLAREQTWGYGALSMAMVMTVAWGILATMVQRRARLSAVIAVSLAGPLLVVFAALTFLSRRDRLEVREGVVVSEQAKMSDERGLVLLAGGGVIPEGARVRILEHRAHLMRIRWGASEAWVQAAAVRPLRRGAS